MIMTLPGHSVFDHLHYAKSESEGLVHFITRMTCLPRQTEGDGGVPEVVVQTHKVAVKIRSPIPLPKMLLYLVFF